VAIGDTYFQQMRKKIFGRLPIIFSIMSPSVSVPETTLYKNNLFTGQQVAEMQT